MATALGKRLRARKCTRDICSWWVCERI